MGHLLAGTSAPSAMEPSTGEFARLVDLLVNQYRYVVVDASSRLDAASRRRRGTTPAQSTELLPTPLSP